MNPIKHSSNQNSKQECIAADLLLEYAEGKVEGIQANAIERHLADCLLCADALEGMTAYGNPSQFLNEVEGLNALAFSKSRSKPIGEKNKKPGARILTFPRIAAAMVSVAAILLVVFMLMPASGPADIAGEYYTPYSGLTMRGNPSEEAMRLYNDGKFAEAAILFSKESDSNSQFYAGSAFLEARDYDNAITAFSKVISINDNYLASDARYYLGLSFLFKDDLENGLKWMRELAAEKEGDYAGKAAAIVKELEKLK